MAQTQQHPDATAWINAARSRNFSVNGSAAEIEKDGAIATMPALEGFAGLKPEVQPLVFHAVAEYVRNRIGGGLNGQSLQQAVNDAINGVGLPNAKNNDARESVYKAMIAELIEAKMPLPENATAAQKLERAALVTASADMESNRKSYYEKAVSEAVAAGRVPAAARERKRTGTKKAGLAL